MSKKLPLKNRLCRPFYGLVFGAILSVLANLGIVALPHTSTPVYAAPESMNATPVNTAPGNTTPATTTNTADTGGTAETNTESGDSSGESTDTCYDQVGAIGWLICPSTGVLGKAIDAVYEQIEKLLVVSPVTTDGNSPIYKVWEIMRDVTNIVFVILLLVVVYSQVTGLGISNYGIKKALPKLVVAAVLVNMSYLICALAVDVSNIIGANLKGVFTSIEESAIAAGGLGDAAKITWTQLTGVLIGGGAIAGVSIGVAGGLGALLWPLIVSLIGGILSVLVGLITIGMRQALISVLIMISPLAFVAYMLPNTESWFKKWKDIFTSMLIFYPMFSLLFGAAQLAGWAIIANSLTNSNFFGVVLGMAVQVFPLILSVSLMKMSGTVLGRVSSKLDALTAKPRGAAKAYGDKRRQLSTDRYINSSQLPSAHLRRYMDKHNRKLEIDTENAAKIRKGRSEVWAQKKIANMLNYDPADAGKYARGELSLRATKSTRDAKLAGNIEMAAKTAQDDAKHLISGGYGEFYDKNETNKALAKQGAENFKEMNRAAFTLINDDEADFNFLTEEFLKAASAGPNSYQFKHFVESSGGGLGVKGSTSVLGQLLAKTAANEARHRHDFAILGNKFNVDKRAFRNMVTGYYVNDDGLATFEPDENGNQPQAYYMEGNKKVYEKYPGEFLRYHPEALHPYKLRDENGPYYEMKDLNGKFVTRIYKHDSPVAKEIFQNFDAVIQDPIDGLYGILAGIKEGTYSEVKDANGNVIAKLPDVGFSNLRTTVARSLDGARFKEKAAFAGPMYTTAVARGYIKNFTDNNIHRLDGIVKAVKAGNFNVQDSFELNLLADLMSPYNFINGRFEYLFPYEDLKTAFDVNGKRLRGTRFDADGNKIDIDPEQATYEDLLTTVKHKYMIPAAQSMAYMMSRATTPNVADAQKSGSAEAWGNLAKAIDMWADPDLAKRAHLPNPYKRNSNTADTAYAMQKKIRENSVPTKDKSAYSTNDPASSNDIVRNHTNDNSQDKEKGNNSNSHIISRDEEKGNNSNNHVISNRNVSSQTNEENSSDQLRQLAEKAANLRDIINNYYSSYMYDPFAFGQSVLELVGEDPEFEDVYYEFSNYIDDNPSATSEELYQSIIDSLYRFDF